MTYQDIQDQATQDQFSLLRELLSQEPSNEHFSSIMALFSEWRDPYSKKLGLDYASAHLESWPDEYRHSSPKRCWSSFPYEQPEASFVLVRKLNLDNHDMSQAEIELIATSSHMKNLTQIDLSYNDIGDEGVKKNSQLSLHHKSRITRSLE